jgi:hypothetical protein
MTPQEPKGEQAQADSAVAVAIRLLENALVAYGSEHVKGAAILHVLPKLTKAFGKDEDKAKEIMPAELQTALMAPGGGGEAEAGGGAPPGGAPPGGGAPPPSGGM